MLSRKRNNNFVLYMIKEHETTAPPITVVSNTKMNYMKACDEVAEIMTGKPSPVGWIVFCEKHDICR